jgi:membrane-associated phospholipid phosphatase
VYNEEAPHVASGSPSVNRFVFILRIWLLVLLGCAAFVAFSFGHWDLPIALYFWKIGRILHPLSKPLGGSVILGVESAVILLLLLTRLLRGHISRFAEVLAIACLTSICAYGIDSQVLKVFFGVPNPTAVIHGARHAFDIMRGSGQSSFPSGHMVLAGSFAGVFMRLYRASIWPLAGLLLLAAALLLVGDWHFLSDLVAGAFVGVTAGLLAGEAWAVHSARRA